jgi:hypothetical protein
MVDRPEVIREIDHMTDYDPYDLLFAPRPTRNYV